MQWHHLAPAPLLQQQTAAVTEEAAQVQLLQLPAEPLLQRQRSLMCPAAQQTVARWLWTQPLPHE